MILELGAQLLKNLVGQASNCQRHRALTTPHTALLHQRVLCFCQSTGYRRLLRRPRRPARPKLLQSTPAFHCSRPASPIDERLQEGEGCQRPLLRHCLGCSHLQGLAVVGDGRVHIDCRRGTRLGAAVVRDTHVVLRFCPV